MGPLSFTLCLLYLLCSAVLAVKEYNDYRTWRDYAQSV